MGGQYIVHHQICISMHEGIFSLMNREEEQWKNKEVAIFLRFLSGLSK